MSAAVASVGAAGLAAALLARGVRMAFPYRLADGAPPGLRLPGSNLMARLLVAAGLAPGAALGWVAAGAILAALAAAGLLGRPVLAPFAAATVVGAGVIYRRGADRRRAAAVVRQLPGLASSLATALRAGLSLRQALTRVAQNAPEPSAAELARVSRELSLGARVEQSLAGLGERVGSREVRLMVAAIEVQRLAGGNLAAALDDLAGRLAERARLARELRGLTAQARLTAWLVGLLPIAAGALVELVAPGTLGRSLLGGPGLVALVVAVALYGTGAALVHRIGRIAT